MAKITRTTTTVLEVTPQEVAKLFCDLDDSQQAQFFNAVAAFVDSWTSTFGYQMLNVIDSKKLDAGGITIMEQIGEYGQEARKEALK